MLWNPNLAWAKPLVDSGHINVYICMFVVFKLCDNNKQAKYLWGESYNDVKMYAPAAIIAYMYKYVLRYNFIKKFKYI